jgi:hypothetical protein
MIFAGFSLSLEARDSNIPNAGLGLWLTILPLWPHDDRLFLELDPGVLVDFGVYAPLLPSDRKSDKISLVKNFLYDWDPEGWNFEMAMHGKSGHFDIFDISDDLSGKLHSIAEKNIICYVNETDGKETPNVVGLHDPEGKHSINSPLPALRPCAIFNLECSFIRSDSLLPWPSLQRSRAPETSFRRYTSGTQSTF